MKKTVAATVACGALAAIVVGCAPLRQATPPVRLPTSRPAALAIVGGHLAADHGEVSGLVAQTAQPNEHLEIIDPSAGQGGTVDPPVAPGVGPIPGPVPPKGLGADPTQFQTDAHNHQEAVYHAKVRADLDLLRTMLTARLRDWSAKLSSALARSGPNGSAGWNLRAGVSQAVSYFASLQEAGVAVGSRRVIVLFWPPSQPAAVVPLPVGSLSGTEVILADFPGDERQQALWQADLLQAGASRAVVLVPEATAAASMVVSQALSGSATIAPTVIRFPLNRASLQPAARATLARLALELRTTYAGDPANILGFADPLGPYSRNLRLSYQRATSADDFLVSHQVAASRLFAVGYGAALPVAPDSATGSQPLDRRVVIVIQTTR